MTLSIGEGNCTNYTYRLAVVNYWYNYEENLTNTKDRVNYYHVLYYDMLRSNMTGHFSYYWLRSQCKIIIDVKLCDGLRVLANSRNPLSTGTVDVRC